MLAVFCTLLFCFYVGINDQKQVFQSVGSKLSNHNSDESETGRHFENISAILKTSRDIRSLASRLEPIKNAET
jgi:hypothetical protein